MRKKHFSIYFKLWYRIKSRQDHFKSMRGTSFGIAVACDEFSVKYQSLEARMYILDCYMNNNIAQSHVIEIYLETYRMNKKMLDKNKKPVDSNI